MAHTWYVFTLKFGMVLCFRDLLVVVVGLKDQHQRNGPLDMAVVEEAFKPLPSLKVEILHY